MDERERAASSARCRGDSTFAAGGKCAARRSQCRARLRDKTGEVRIIGAMGVPQQDLAPAPLADPRRSGQAV
jgi:hypothetical protein